MELLRKGVRWKWTDAKVCMKKINVVEKNVEGRKKIKTSLNMIVARKRIRVQKN